MLLRKIFVIYLMFSGTLNVYGQGFGIEDLFSVSVADKTHAFLISEEKIPFKVEVRDGDYREEFEFNDQFQIKLPIGNLSKEATFQLYYPKIEYRNAIRNIQNEIKNEYLGTLILCGKLPNPPEIADSGSVIKDLLEEYVENLNREFFGNPCEGLANRLREFIVQRIIIITNLNRIYQASEDNKLGPFELKKYIDDIKESRLGAQPGFMIDAFFTLYKESLGNYWARSGDNQYAYRNISYGLFVGRKLFGGINIANETYLGSYLFMDIEHFSHGLLNGTIDNDYPDLYVSNEYVNKSNQEYYKIISENQVQLRTNQVSVGFLLDIYRYNTIYLNVGIGYNFHQWATVRFKKMDSEGQEIDHLDPSQDLSIFRQKDIINYNKDIRDNAYLIFRVGTRQKSESRASFFLSGKIYYRDLPFDNNYQFYKEGPVSSNGLPSFEIAPITEGNQLFFVINFGLGFHSGK